jgi:diguanylate cyclase (GGDEF)-like protein
MQALIDAAPVGRALGRIARLTSAWSLRAKVLVIAFLATHVPLLVTVGYLLFAADQLSRELVLGIVVAATVLGAAMVVWTLDRLLRPLTLASQALNEYVARGRLPSLPVGGADEVGMLLNQLARALDSAEQRTVHLEAQAYRDHLTGLLNRRAAESRLTHSLALLERSSIPMCVALLDVDHFKRVNDSLGHIESDRVLTGVAATVRQHARRKSDWAARWGGDELLLALYTDLRTATTILDRLRADITEGRFAGGVPAVTVSIGVTTCLPGEDIDGCLARADAALYRAKQGGRNRVVAAE